MPSFVLRPRRVALGSVIAAAVLVLLFPLALSAHSELQSSDPAAGASVPSPFSGPVVLTFSEALADGSKADLAGPDGSTVATATIDATAATMTFTFTAPLTPGAYQVKWTSIAGDGDLLRGIVTFSVVAASPSLQAASPAASSTVATNPPDAAATAGLATPAASPASSGATDTASSGDDAVLAIGIALILAAVGVFYLFRRRPA